MKRFTDGLIFGAGFGISFLLLSYLAAFVLYPILPERVIATDAYRPAFVTTGTTTPSPVNPGNRETAPERPYHDLPFEEQIDQAIAIIITKYESGPDGLRKAMVTEYLKGAPSSDFPYKVGDEIPGQSFYAKPDESKGEGSVVFYVGRSDISQMSFQYEGDTLNSFGQMPLDVLRKKCRKVPDA